MKDKEIWDIIIPVHGEYLTAKGMGHLLQTVSKVHKQINPNLKIGGVLLTEERNSKGL